MPEGEVRVCSSPWHSTIKSMRPHACPACGATEATQGQPPQPTGPDAE